MPPLSRRAFLAGTAATGLLTACSGGHGDGDGEEAADPGPSGPATDARGGVVLVPAFNRNTYLLAGVTQRVTLVLFQDEGGLVEVADAPTSLTMTATGPGGAEVTAAVERHGDDLDRPYYPFAATFPAAGVWDLAVEVGAETLVLQAQVKGTVAFPQVGDPMPVLTTPTVRAPLDAATICTRIPPCPFHEVDLATALSAGRPTAVLLSTPAYCQVAICGPVLDLLIEGTGTGPADRAFIHVEVFPNGDGSGPGPISRVVADGFAVDFEPVLFVADATGTITARLDSIYDADELAAALRG